MPLFYLEQEVQLEGWARNIGHFARFLESISLSHGAVLNISNVARNCQIERKPPPAMWRFSKTCFWAIEVKNTRWVRPEDLGGLKSFAADYPECETLLLCRGQERLKIDRIRCLPVEDFLRDLKPSRRSIASK
jgi:hypothetical protein